MALLSSASHTIVDVNDNFLAVLTNDSHTLPANSSGTVTSYAGAVTKINIYRGADQELDTSWTYTLEKSSAIAGFTATITASGLLTVSAFPASLDSGYVDITATKDGIALTKRLTITKSKQGSGGANGVAYWQVASSDVIKRGTNNLYTPATITVKNMTANGTTVSAYSGRFKIYEATDAAGSVFGTAIYTSSVNESERIYTPPNYATKAITAIKIETYLADGVTLVDTTTIPVLLDGEKGVPGDKGDPGINGNDALSVLLMNENQSIAVTSGRLATVAQTISIPFAAYLGSTRIPATISPGTLPAGVTVTSNVASTASADGVLTLTVAVNANLGGVTTAFDAGRIEMTINANSVSILKVFNWSKTVAGAAGATARVYFVEPSSSVIVKTPTGSYVPSSLVFSSFYKDGTTASKVAYAAFWRIETTTDGTTWTSYVTQVTSSVSYTLATIPANIKGLRVTTYSTSALTPAVAVDTQTVMVVTEGSKGDAGSTTYTWVKYADDINGTGMSDSPTDKRFMGLAPNKTTLVESNVASDYKWSPLYDNVIVGGRNILRKSQKLTNFSNNAASYPVETVESEEYTSYISRQGTGTPTFSLYNNIPALTAITDWSWKNQDITASVDIRYTKNGQANLRLIDTGNTIDTSLATADTTLVAGQWIRCSVTASNVSEDLKETSTIRIMISVGGVTLNETLDVKNWKIEKGNVRTDWTAAPEDLGVEATDKANAAQLAAELYASAQAELMILQAEAYADGRITEEETARITDAANKLQEAKTYAEKVAGEAVKELDLSGYATNTIVENLEISLKKEISATTGLNMFRNSIGYAKLDYWEHTVTGNPSVTSLMNERLRVLGYGSGFYFPAQTGTTAKGIQQTVNVTPGQPYTLSWFINRATAGAFIVTIYEGITLKQTIPDGSNVDGEFSTEYFVYIPEGNQMTVRFEAAAETEALLTGVMLGLGTMPTQWTLANGELYNAYVRIDDNGLVVIRVDENGEIEGFTNMTPEEFAGYYDENRDGNYERIFWFNRDETVTKKLKALDEITMGTIKVIRVEGALNRGWAFVPIVPE